MKKLCGYDLNGFRDLGSRNWTLRPDGEEDEVIDGVLTEGAILGALVRVGDGRGRYIGGAQAMLAPHGQGNGWGEVGRLEKRLSLRGLLADRDVSVDQLSLALTGLFSGASVGIASIDDLPDASEILQERLLLALRKARISTPMLVWRPVLACLSAIATSVVSRPGRVGVVCHARSGFAVQVLTIRTAKTASTGLLAPERRSTGTLITSDWGYDHLVRQATDAIRGALSPDWRGAIESARSIGMLGLGIPACPEILRLDNGEWEVLSPPAHLNPGSPSIPGEIADLLDGCDLVLLETLTEGAIRDAIQQQLAALLGRNVVGLPVRAVSDGALFAAHRLARREPIYFDFLPQIATIVQTREGAESYDLIDSDATLPAGEVYRSAKPARFAIQAGQDRFSIYINKQTADWPRKAEVVLGARLTQQTPVGLWVEQIPAAGRAKIILNSEGLGQQFQVDWDGATEIQRAWAEIIESFERSAPTIPARLVLPCGMAAWNDSVRGDGLLKLLSANVDRREVDWAALAARMSARPEGRYAISSDGEIPAAVGAKATDHLQSLIDRATEQVRGRLAGRIDASNDSLRFLTWLFRRCPEEVAGWLLEAWDQQVRGHRLFSHVSHWKLAYQGFGRIAGRRALEQQAIHKILQKTINDWSWQRETAAMAFMLSRSDSAPRLLTRKDVDRIAKRVMREFADSLGSTYSRFHYAPFLLVGLLRWRLVEPFALVNGQDAVADKLTLTVQRTLQDLGRAKHVRPNLRYAPILKQILEELEGEGSNPELLLDIYGRGEEGDDDSV